MRPRFFNSYVFLSTQSLRCLLSALLCGFFLQIAGCYNSASNYERLVLSHAEAFGRISHIDCANHGAVYYSFEVNGKILNARAPRDFIVCATAKIGDPLIVFYDPQNPSVNSLLQPDDAYRNEKGWYVPEWLWPILGVALVTVGGAALSLNTKRQ
jgi:hypothetical protein